MIAHMMTHAVMVLVSLVLDKDPSYLFREKLATVRPSCSIYPDIHPPFVESRLFLRNREQLIS